MNVSDNSLITQMYDDVSTGICVFDENGKFLYMNNAFLKIRNVSRSFYETLTAFDLLNNNLIDKLILSTVREKQIPISDVQNVVSTDGIHLRKQLVTAYPIFDEHKEIKNYIAYYKNLDSFIQYDDNFEEQKIALPGINTPIVAKSPLTKALYAKAKDVADTDATVLITGETGTGKEVLAKYIHECSHRRKKHLIVVDCTSLPASLMEAELFGYEKGSFTGANASKAGLIENADGGTLFLDEINSLPLDLQGKLLRTIETKTIKRIGSVKTKAIDFRLIVAANIDLLQCVKEKTFRLDLYYRINVLTFHIPALRNRKEDIIPLTQIYEQTFRKKYNRNREITTKLYNEMLAYNWPGNVRELKNFVERLVIIGPEENTLNIDSIPPLLSREPVTTHPELNSSVPTPTIPVGFPPELTTDNTNTNLPAALEIADPAKGPMLTRSLSPEQEKSIIQTALNQHGNHREKTAAYLNISRRTLQYKLKKYNLL